MTDQFETRLAAVLRADAERAVRAIDAVEIATAARSARTRRALPGLDGGQVLGQSFRTAAALLLLLLALAASIWLVASGIVRTRPIVDASPSDSPTPGDLAANATSAWLADIPDGIVFDGNPNADRMALIVGAGQTAAIDLVGRTTGLLRSNFSTLNIGEVRLTTDTASSGAVSIGGSPFEACRPGDAGSYQSTTSPDGSLLTLKLLNDDCRARGAAFARTWTRSLTVPNGGGTGVVDGFDPLFVVELPPGGYVVASSADHRTIYQDLPELQFLAFKDPQGFLDPCDLSKGRRSIAPGADHVVAYFQQLAGFTVDSVVELTVDGYRAVRLVVHADEDASCPDDRLWEWQPKAEPVSGSAWFVHPGVTDSLIIVDHPAGTVMFELLPAPNPREAEVIGSIRFLDELPTTP